MFGYPHSLDYYVQQYPALIREIGNVVIELASEGNLLFYIRYNNIEIQDRFAKGLGWIRQDPSDRRFKPILIKKLTDPLSLKGTFKVIFPHCRIVQVVLDFEETDRFNHLLEQLRRLTSCISDRLDELLDFLDLGDFPIVMMVEEIQAE